MSADKTSRVLVTGANGFIGSRLTRSLLADGATVAAVVRPTSALDQLGDAAGAVTVLRHDGSTSQLNDFTTEFAPTVVYHLAANFVGVHTSDDVSALIADNVAFTAQICEAMVAARAHCLVAAGTVWQHANTPDGELAPSPNSLYAASKQAAEDIIAYFAQTGALSSIVLKIYDSYGPDDPRPKFLSALAAAAEAGETLNATLGDQKLHLVHVDDIVAAFRRAGAMLRPASPDGHHSFALPSAEAMTLRELVDAWCKATGRTVEVAWGARTERPGEIMVPWEGPPMPGWKPKIPLDAGFKAVWGA